MTTTQELLSVVEARFNAYLTKGEEPPADLVLYRNALTAAASQVSVTATTSSSGLLTDGVQTFFVLLDTATGGVGYYRTDTGAAYTPVATPVAVADRELLTALYIALTTESGQWEPNDELTLKQVTNTTNSQVLTTQWFNGLTLLTTAPVIGEDVISADLIYDSTLKAILQKLTEARNNVGGFWNVPATNDTGNFQFGQFVKRFLKRVFRDRTNVTGITSTSGDNTIISAPAAGVRIVVTDLRIQSESSTAQTVVLKDGATAVSRLRLASDGAGTDRVYGIGNELRLSAATALVLNLGAAEAVGYTVRYYTESSTTGL